MRKKYMPLLLSAFLLFTACDDWLDVQQNTEKKEEQMFDTYKGFQGALMGCYDDLAKTNLYGDKLMYSYIESMANLWYVGSSADNLWPKVLPNYYFMTHEYGHSVAEDEIKKIYADLFNTVLEANMVIKGCKEKGHVMPDPKVRAIVEGEAYAVRALCQFDILRLFGQVPDNPTILVSLPYSEVTTKDERPLYYAYEQYVAKLKTDFETALSLLKDNDPVFEYTYEEFNKAGSKGYEHVTIEDGFMTFRQHRLNYWAVRALQARMYMYIGEKGNAYDVAMEVINAKTKSGKAVVTLSAQADTKNKYYAYPSESLFMVSKAGLEDESVDMLLGDEKLQVYDGRQLLIKEDSHGSLFDGAWATDIRKQNMWAPVQTSQGKKFMSIRKHYYNSDELSQDTKVAVLATKLELLPLIRLSEIYLIAVESALTLGEANNLYSNYLASKNAQMEIPFASNNDIRNEMLKEYRREFFAEGVMFYLYKRYQTTRMWSRENVEVSERDYILPLPNTEYNPN